MAKPLLLFAVGNLSRGDDALGPQLLSLIEASADLSQLDLLCDFQLQIEHALDLRDRQLVLFIDAAVNLEGAFSFNQLQPTHDRSYSSHAMSPAALLQVYQQIQHCPPPPSFLLGIHGQQFELGAELSVSAAQHLQLATDWLLPLLSNPKLADWQQHTDHARAVAA